MKGNHPKGKGKTFRKPAIKGGKFVKIKERCKTFSYCNQGPEAIQITEALDLKKDPENSKLIVISTLEGKAANQETFKNKDILSKNGFKWVNGAWTIDINEFDKAKKIISLINNSNNKSNNESDYLLKNLDDLEVVVNNAVNTDKKELLKNKLDDYIEKLAKMTDERAMSDEIKRYLNFFAKFHQYSFFNRILIFIQRPDARKVASFTTWKKKNRKIKKNAKGILILRPLFDDKKLDSLDLTDLEKLENANIDMSTTPKRFKAEYVFDVSDTEPMNEKGEIPSEPQWWGDNEPSETADDLFETVKQVAKNLKIDITTSNSNKGEKGYSRGGHINLTSDVKGVGRVSTMIHELAHELMHWKGKSKFYIGDENKRNTALLELQAESVAYVILTHYDIPAEFHTTTYLSLWGANSESIRKNKEILFSVSQFIIDKIDEIMDKENKTDGEKNKTKIDEIINEMINNLG